MVFGGGIFVNRLEISKKQRKVASVSKLSCIVSAKVKESLM